LLESWNTQKASAILQLALSQLRSEGAFSDRTLDAFEGVGLSGRSCKDVAETLDMDVEDVYAAKYRVGKALKNIVTKIETAYDI
jgi:hypothetical protein